MHAWLFVLAVLAIFHKVTQVASTEHVSPMSPQYNAPKELTSYSYTLSSTEDKSNKNTIIVNSHIRSSDSFNFLIKSKNSEISDINSRIIVNNVNSSKNNNEFIVKETEDSSSPKIYEKAENFQDDSNTHGSEEIETNEIDENFHQQRHRPNPEQLAEIEKNLLSLFGFSKRPRIDRSKIVIPDAMKKLYEQITGHRLDTELNLPKRSKPTSDELHLNNINTIRSFIHEGKNLSLCRNKINS